MKNNIHITKASGDSVIYDESKLRHSLKRSKASDSLIETTLKLVRDSLYDGISAKKIYTLAFNSLKSKTPSAAGRYKLKKAIMELGPTGFPFEKFVGEILKNEGYTTKVGVIVQGHCVTHEVDVEAEKESKHYMIECKFHHDQRTNCSVKIPLYIHSRFQDVEKNWKKMKGHATKFHQGWIVTNTRFSDDATKYGVCAGLNLVSWDYPSTGGSLKERIDRSGLHPITCLTSLSKKEKQLLLDKDIVLTKMLCDRPAILDEIGITKTKQARIIQESNELCKL